MPVPRVFICHRNQLLSECLAAALNSPGNLDCQVVTSQDALTRSPASFGRVAIDLLLLDATLNDDLSAQVARRFKGLYAGIKLVLVIAEHAVDRLFEFAQMGSQGYLFEGSGLADARNAIQTVLDGEQYCSSQLVNALLFQAGRVDQGREPSRPRDYGHLTTRERGILELIAFQQMANKQIARQLRLSIYTVKNHVHNIIDKLGAHDRHDAIQVARRRGLLGGETSSPVDTSTSHG